jgi:hypothetical protein
MPRRFTRNRRGQKLRPRMPNGERARVRSGPVLPTAELLAHRLRATGRTDVADALPLDALRARELISRDQFLAGKEFSRVRSSAGFKGAALAATDLTAGAPRSMPRPVAADVEPTASQDMADYQRALAALRSAGAWATSITCRVLIGFEALSPSDAVSITALRRGLTALAHHFWPDAVDAAIEDEAA